MIRFAVSTLLLLLSWEQAGTCEPGAAWVLDDFEDGDRTAASGLSWIPISDALTGGGSRARLAVIETDGGGSRKALRVTGEVAKNGYAGVWTAIAPGGVPADVSAFTGIRVRARGRGTFAAGLRGGPMAGANFMASLTAKPDATVTEISFDSPRAQSSAHARAGRTATSAVRPRQRAVARGPGGRSRRLPDRNRRGRSRQVARISFDHARLRDRAGIRHPSAVHRC